ncbi:sensor histidine kinase [Rossellomorea aquimaris]|uniref:cache domain-containing sensor histidine kinase n=1 Tax=Rossellomorea aquimaris TaxID=189382 RepID=UPI001CD4AB88|nr:sensor histidine kinase [Rossellomorea aquimaris]MCA1054935.1 sensor histidine kinase [Rossellomorea aquimaris]
MKQWLKSLRAQIFLFTMLISIITISILGIIVYFGSSKVVLQQSIQTSKMAVEKGSASVGMYIERLNVLSELLAKDPSTKQALSSEDRSGESNLNTIINNVLDSDPNIQSVIVIGKDGYVMSNEKDLNMTLSSDMMKEKWYTAALKERGIPVLTSARMQKFSMDQDNWVISISREVRDESGQHLGVVLLDIQYKGIEDAFHDLMLGQNGYAFILNNSGELVYHRDPSYFTDKGKKQELLDIWKSKEGYDGANNTLVHKANIQNSDWVLVGVSSLDGLSQVRKQLLGTILIVGIGLFVLVLIVTPLVAKRITNPIHRLEKAMQKVQHGVLDVHVTESGIAEVEHLSKHFNVMTKEIKRLLKDIEQKEKDLRSYELSVLRGQINPHFLYNTLDTIVWMAEFNDSERVIMVTKALAQFFQLSLSGGNEFTTIENELNHVKQYLIIQKERYGEKLNYTIDADQEILEVKIPKIILQPLIENAIYHGIREKSVNGHIQISAKKDESSIKLIVEDDGVGFDPQTRLEQVSDEQSIRLGGIGIRNVDDRLKLYYGEEYGVTVDSVVGVGTRVVVVLPGDLG